MGEAESAAQDCAQPPKDIVGEVEVDRPSKEENIKDESLETEVTVKAEATLVRSKRTRKLPKSKDLENETPTRSRKARQGFPSRGQIFKKKRGPLWTLLPLQRYARPGFRTRRKTAEKDKKLPAVNAKTKYSLASMQIKAKPKSRPAQVKILFRSPDKARTKQSIVTRSMKLKLLMENLENMKKIELQNLRAMRKLTQSFVRRNIPVEASHVQQIFRVNLSQCEEVIRRIDKLISTMHKLQHHGIRLCSRLKCLPSPKSGTKGTKVAEIRKKFVEKINLSNLLNDEAMEV